MPKIFFVIAAHLVLIAIGSLAIDQLVLGIGFSDSATTKSAYIWLSEIWHILNAPASYLFYPLEDYRWIWLLIQLATSFIWANLYILTWSLWKKRSRPVT